VIGSLSQDFPSPAIDKRYLWLNLWGHITGQSRLLIVTECEEDFDTETDSLHFLCDQPETGGQ